MPDPNTEKFEAVRDHLNRADLSSSEQYDRAILTLSTGGLGFSIAFIKFIVPLTVAKHLWLLVVSWSCFVAAIILTLVSFMTTKWAIKDTRMYAFMYYIKSDDDYGSKVSLYSRITYYLNLVSGSVFIAAIVLTVVFASINVQTEPNMNEENRIVEPGEKKGYVPPPANSGGQPKPVEPKEPTEEKPKTDEGGN